jgi:hypothetical protein
MTAIAVDPAGGGSDAQEIATRHGGWFALLNTEKGESTAEPARAFGHVMATRRDNAPVIVDVGGGYGDKIVLRLKDNGVEHIRFNGADASRKRTKGSNIPFANRRAEAWWKMREELDPDQEGGSCIALPPDPELRADLAAVCYEPRALEVRGVYQIESKDDLRKRLGRSPGKGDAVVMCLSEGGSAMRRKDRRNGSTPKITLGYSHLKQHRPRA